MTKVMVVCQIKNAALWVKRYIRCLEAQTVPLHIVCMYGSSVDATFSILKHWSRSTKHKVEVYREPYLPPEERANFMLARIKRDFQTLFLESKHDYYFVCDPDIVEMPPDLVEQLIADSLDLVAPYVWIEGRQRRTFFDTYGYRKNGSRFHVYNPPGVDSDEPLEVDSVGSCYLATREVMKQGVYTNPYPHNQFCKSVIDKGFKVWVDPRINITHVDLERYGLHHFPPNIPLTESPFIDKDGVLYPVEQIQAQEAYQAVEDYNAWILENKPEEFLWTRQFNSSRPLITASYKVLNEAEYLPYSLESVYPYVDRIDIVEGAVKKSMHCAHSDGSSLDETVELIDLFPDPDNKIRLVQGRWKSKEHMQAKLLELCESRWMMYIDGDELYLSDDLAQVRQFCQENLSGRIVYAVPGRTLNFWHDWQHIAYSLNEQSPWGKTASMHPFLVWRDVPGLNFNFFHTYPLDGMARNLALSRQYEDKRAVLNNVLLYHYGHAKSAVNVYNKLLYFKNRGSGEGSLLTAGPKDDMWFSGEMPGDFVIRPFKGEPPLPLKNHPLYGETLIKVTSKKPVYKFERLEKDSGASKQ